MPNFKVAPRVKQTSTSSGTGTLNLDGAAAASYENFSDQFSTGDLVGYVAVHSSADEWEEGIGTVTTGSPWTLARTTVLKSSNANAAVNFTAGGLDVFSAIPTPFVPGSLSLRVTRQNVSSTSETDTSVLTVPANTWGNGEELELREYCTAMNNTGGTVLWTRKLYVNGSGVTTLNSSQTANAAPLGSGYEVGIIRIGADLYYFSGGGFTSTDYSRVPVSALIRAGSNRLTLLASGVDFASAISIKLTMQLATYNAATSFYNAIGGKAQLG